MSDSLNSQQNQHINHTVAQSDEQMCQFLRSHGVTIGQRCRIYTTHFSTEPYLVTLGDDVGISGGVKIITHNGAARLLKHIRPDIQALGKVVIGNNTFIGENAIILPGTSIGDNCIIGAGAVVHGKIPDNSLVVGNPGKIVGRASTYLELLLNHPDTIDTFSMEPNARRRFISEHFFGNESAKVE